METHSEHPHRRYNPLTGEWVLVSPHRSERPWQGQTESLSEPLLPSHDPECQLCPGNTRASGTQNSEYDSTFVFTNDFGALLPGSRDADLDGDLFRSQTVAGECRVVCFSPNHGKTLAELSTGEIQSVISTWAVQLEELSKQYAWVQIFENKGEVMGCSQPHPHGQIWATSFVPNEVATEDKQLQEHFHQKGSNLLLDYASAESRDGERTVVDTEHWLAVVPYWATWPFETLLLPKEKTHNLTTLSAEQQKDLAKALQELTIRYDNLFECSFPYSMGWHFAPCKLTDCEHWQLHAHFYPPLLRSSTVKKFMVGFEMLAEAQRDLTPEQAAEKLRATDTIHYKAK